MRTIGLLGGMSWESTAIYYHLLNEMARTHLGGLHSAQILLWSFDFAEIAALQAAGEWDRAAERLIDAARRLARGGAECLVICTNTMHGMAGTVAASVDIPLLHIADATAVAVKAAGVRRPLLLATRYTMEQDFYKGRLRGRYGIDVVVPDERERHTVHAVIYDELCRGVVRPESRAAYLRIVERLRGEGADGVIFGCTEVGLLLSEDDLPVPAFDTTFLHARAAFEFAVADEAGAQAAE